MAKVESTSNVRYQEPSLLDVYHEPVEDRESRERWLANDYRVRQIVAGVVTFEKRQPNVLRYPPVYVGVPREFKGAQEYLDTPARSKT